ncbi:MAG TPA: RNHCP domain-containing protein [Thermomicrobiales bacterium]|nr:RNHCP domain-containing protein [Thermomicrobiales bacterium]
MAFDASDEAAIQCAYFDDDDAGVASGPRRKPNRDRPGRDQRHERAGQRPHAHHATKERRGPTRAARLGLEEFKCRRCHTFVGPAVSGGRHRNHCPRCLYSRHVDARRPGDRASECGALMAPVGRFDRPDGEPVVVHQCGGCGVVRHNRLAADDDIIVLARLPLIQPWLGQRDDVDPARRVS